ncbi:MAG TPA: hypothetical protein VFK79_12325 [Xanthobacteraceae bacterium]|nr:hypothetical protein [Xanthobacteraceae bacterium]
MRKNLFYDFDALHSRINDHAAFACAFDLLLVDDDDIRRAPPGIDGALAAPQGFSSQRAPAAPRFRPKPPRAVSTHHVHSGGMAPVESALTARRRARQAPGF